MGNYNLILNKSSENIKISSLTLHRELLDNIIDLFWTLYRLDPDCAKELNGEGFNAVDSLIFHKIFNGYGKRCEAHSPIVEEQIVKHVHRLKKYLPQLRSLGIEIPVRVTAHFNGGAKHE